MLTQLSQFRQNCMLERIWNAGKNENVIGTVLFMQEWTISTQMMFNKIYLACTTFYLNHLRAC